MKFAFIFLLYISSATAKTLVITDSHGEGAFGSELVKGLEAKDKHVFMRAVGGSTPTDWVEGKQQVWGYWEYETGKPDLRRTKPLTPKFENLLEQIHPDEVIIELGTNLIWNDLTSQDTNNIRELIRLTLNHGARCIWIGLPDLRPRLLDAYRESQIQKLLTQEVLPSCELIQSWTFTSYPESGGDGIHYDQIPVSGEELARGWAKEALEHIRSF